MGYKRQDYVFSPCKILCNPLPSLYTRSNKRARCCKQHLCLFLGSEATGQRGEGEEEEEEAALVTRHLKSRLLFGFLKKRLANFFILLFSGLLREKNQSTSTVNFVIVQQQQQQCRILRLSSHSNKSVAHS